MASPLTFTPTALKSLSRINKTAAQLGFNLEQTAISEYEDCCAVVAHRALPGILDTPVRWPGNISCNPTVPPPATPIIICLRPKYPHRAAPRQPDRTAAAARHSARACCPSAERCWCGRCSQHAPLPMVERSAPRRCACSSDSSVR